MKKALGVAALFIETVLAFVSVEPFWVKVVVVFSMTGIIFLAITEDVRKNKKVIEEKE